MARPGKRPKLVPAPNGDAPLAQLPAEVVAGLQRWLDDGQHYTGRRNVYRCDTCGGLTHTVDLHTGTTPAFLGCRRTAGCPGRAVSAGYPSAPVPADYPPAPWEWYRPSATELRTMEPAMRHHVLQGGLALRPAAVGQ